MAEGTFGAPSRWRPPAWAPSPPVRLAGITEKSAGAAMAQKLLHREGMTTPTTAESTFFAPLPRERGISDGFDSLADSELVAVLLGTGEKGRPVLRVAADMLEQSAGLVGLSRMGPHAL